MIEEILVRNEKLAQELLNKGASKKNPELPQGFGVKVKMSKKNIEE